MDWTAQRREMTPGGLARIRAGDGPPVVLIHGVGLRSEAWSAQIRSLSDHYTVFAIDLPGHGESRLVAPQATLADFTDICAAALSGVDAPVCLAGHSMGAMIALDLAARFPARIRCVAALNAIYRRSPEATEAVRARAASLPSAGHADPGPTLARWFGQDVTGEAVRACADWLRSVDPVAYRTAYGVFAHADGPDEAQLKGLTMPALFMTGSNEPNSTPAMSRTMAALAPVGEVHIVEGAAHMMPMTHHDEVTGQLRAFFQKSGSNLR